MNKIFFLGYFPLRFSDIGDHAITLASLEIFRDLFPDYQVECFSRFNIDDFLKCHLSKEDVIFWCGSGDFGHGQNHLGRKKVIVKWPHNRFIQLPISAYYPTEKDYLIDKKFLDGRDTLTVLARNKEGLNVIKDLGCETLLFPDVAFYLKPDLLGFRRFGTLFILREDYYSTIYRTTSPKIIKALGKIGKKDLDFVFKKYYAKFLKMVRRKFISQKLNALYPGCAIGDFNMFPRGIPNLKFIYNWLMFYQLWEKVVSDRYHALVFSYITRTPFKALPCEMPNKNKIDLSLDYNKYFREFRKIVNL